MGAPVLWSIRAEVRSEIATRPALFRVVSTVSPRRRALYVRRTSDVVIEGYPRSANTFGVHAFRHANPTAQIAHHRHAAAHVLRATRLGIPTMLLIRPPRDAVASEVIREPRITLRRALREYVSFYEAAWHGRDGFVVAPFDMVTARYGDAIDRLNERFGTAFARYENSAADDAEVFGRIEEVNRRKHGADRLEDRIPRPSNARAAARREVDAMLAGSELGASVAAAERLHAMYLGLIPSTTTEPA